MPFACHIKNKVFILFLVFPFIGRTQIKNCGLQPTQNIFWNSLTCNNGLSQNSVTSIIQDSKGFIWIGTYDGLNRFDGFTTQVKRHESNNSNSLSDNRVLCLQEDRQGKILVGTDGGGINIFDPAKEKFLHIPVIQGTGAGNVVLAICSDKDGNMWAGTSNGLAIIQNTSDGYLSNNIEFPAAFINQAISKIICDRAGNIWIGTHDGLYLSKSNKNLQKRLGMLQQVKSFEHVPITAIYQDNQHNIWIGNNGGLYTAGFIGDQSSNELIIKERYKELFAAEKQLVDISDICSDRSGNLWIGSRNAGIYKFTCLADGKIFMDNLYNTRQPFCNMSEDMIRVVFTDLSNTLWLGTYRKGVNYFNLSSKNFYSFNPLLSGQTGELGYKGKYITTVVENRDDLWIGTYDEGLYYYNKCTKQLSNCNAQIDSKNIICLYRAKDSTIWAGGNNGLYKVNGKHQATAIQKQAGVRSICEDSNGRLWVATWQGITIYDPVTHITKAITAQNGLSSNTCFTLYADPFEKVIWVGTIGGGLNRIEYTDTGSMKFSRYLYDEKNRNSISNNHVWCIYRDKQQVLWIGTDAGLNRCNFSSKNVIAVFQHIDNPLLKDRKITSILEDEEKNLWLSSSQGLFKYNTLNDHTRQYTHKDGVQSNTFSEAAFKSLDGRMYFGGINGLNYFYPQQIQSNPYLASTAIVDFKIFNKSILAGEKQENEIILDNDINATNQITLSYKQNNFLLNFAALHFAVPEDNHFRYKLQGYDKDWIVTGYERRFAAYSNLDAGKYTFKLTSSNNDDVWNGAVKTISIIIKPAPWLTWWAKTLYVFLAAGLAWLVFSYIKVKHDFKNELYLEKIEKEKITELNEMKLNFFTNITHELRTPLNLITGPMQELIQKIGGYDLFTQFRLKMVHRNALRLLELINQVLDLRKISADSQRLVISKNDLVKTIDEIKRSFNWMAEQKQIDFKFDYPSSTVAGWFDRDKLEKIIFNIISNAFKYTSVPGEISVRLTVDNLDSPAASATIIVKDDGPGIDKMEQENIFGLFYQCKEHNSHGTGIGLALSRKLTQLHRGSLTVESEPGSGAAFILSIPISRHAYIPGEVYEGLEAEHSAGTIDREKDILNNRVVTGKKKMVLIIEDDEDQRAYMKDCLCHEFEIRDEKNGLEGFETAAILKPDLIITDIMMPGLNGIELSKKLKSDARTHHIPVIIHSVKNNGLTLQEAYEAGADDIVVKPYDYRVLSIKINNVLQSRSRLLKNTYIEKLMRPAEIDMPSEQESFVKHIVSLVEQNMSDPDFSVEKLARLAAMSRMNLHRKLHAITGKSASEFVREIRLRKAGEFISSGSKRVNEVMYEVGISSNYHFNKYFREMYGVSPKEYMNNKAKTI